MDTATLDITTDEAKERLAVYEAQLAEERTVEDDAIRAGYRAAARGLPVISLSQTIERGGYFPNGLPRLAVVRANATVCHVNVRPGTVDRLRVTFTDREWDNGRAAVGQYRVEVQVPQPEETKSKPGRRWARGRTIVPIIPPQHRPNRRRLHLFHILWEVEAWDPTPPIDPALLRHIRGDLWSVVAAWDLTPLERAVLAARATT